MNKFTKKLGNVKLLDLLCFVVHNKDDIKFLETQMKRYGEAINQTAEIHKCTASYVRMIVRGVRVNADIQATYNKLKIGTGKLVEKLKENQES